MIAILIGLAFPIPAVALYFGVAVFLVVPFRDAAQVLFGRRSPPGPCVLRRARPLDVQRCVPGNGRLVEVLMVKALMPTYRVSIQDIWAKRFGPERFRRGAAPHLPGKRGEELTL